MQVEVLSDLRVLINKQKAASQAAQEDGPPPLVTSQSDGAAADARPRAGEMPQRQRSVPARIETTRSALADKETSSPSDALSPCSEVLLRRRWHAAGPTAQSSGAEGVLDDHGLPLTEPSSLECGLASASLAASPPREPSIAIRLDLPVPTALGRSSTNDGQEPPAGLALRSPLAAFGSVSQSNTPRVRAARSFGKSKAAEAPPSPADKPVLAAQPKPQPAAGEAEALPALGDSLGDDCEGGDKENALEAPRLDELDAKSKRLHDADKDGTVFRLLLGEHEPVLPVISMSQADGDDFFVLADEPLAGALPWAAEHDAIAPPTGEPPAWSGVLSWAKFAAHFLAETLEPYADNSGAMLGATTAVATTLAVVAVVVISVRSR